MYSDLKSMISDTLLQKQDVDTKNALEQGKKFNNIQNTIFTKYIPNLSDLKNSTEGFNVSRETLETMETSTELYDNNDKRLKYIKSMGVLNT